MRTKLIIIILSFMLMVALLLITMPLQAEAETASGGGEVEEEVNTGQDITKPIWRFDFRDNFQKITKDAFRKTLTLRMDAPLRFGDGWIFTNRIDLPTSFSDAVSKDNRNGEIEGGLSDILTQFVLIPPPPSKQFAWGFGAQFLWPTATKDNLGTEKFQVAPLLGARYTLPWISKGSFAILALRYFSSYAETEKDRDDISELAIQPVIHIMMPKEWEAPIDFVDFWAGVDIRYNNQDGRTKEEGDWFVPFDILIGKMLSKNSGASVEFAVPIVNDYDLFDWLVEFRIGFFF